MSLLSGISNMYFGRGFGDGRMIGRYNGIFVYIKTYVGFNHFSREQMIELRYLFSNIDFTSTLSTTLEILEK